MRRVDRYRRRGFGYLAVLGIATIVSVIGLSALMTARIELRAARQGEDAVMARLGASAAIELAVDAMAANTNWRNTYSHDAWTSAFAVEDVTYSFKLVDEQDGDLANDLNQPVRLYGKATVADAVRIYSVLLVGSPILETRIATGNDDAEQRSSDGWMYRDSPDLDMAYDDFYGTTVVGLRFTNVAISQGTAIQSAYVQFTAEDTDSGAVFLAVRGEDTDDASQFTDSAYNISTRSTTTLVAWSPPAWDTEGAAGADQRTPDISSIIQEIVDRPGWSSGNALVIIITGAGTRKATSYDGDAGDAPLLHVEWGSSGSLIPVSGSWRREVDAS